MRSVTKHADTLAERKCLYQKRGRLSCTWSCGSCGSIGSCGSCGLAGKEQKKYKINRLYLKDGCCPWRCFLLISPSRHSNISSFQRWLNFSGPDVVAWIKLQVLKTTTPLLPQGNVNKLFTSPASRLQEPNLLQCFSSKLVNQMF